MTLTHDQAKWLFEKLAREGECWHEFEFELVGCRNPNIGDYYIDGQWRKKTSYDVPDDVKAPFKKETQYWVKSIMRV